LYLSCPAVSHISNLTVVFSSSDIVCVKKAAPIVLSLYESNWPWKVVSKLDGGEQLRKRTLTKRKTMELYVEVSTETEDQNQEGAPFPRQILLEMDVRIAAELLQGERLHTPSSTSLNCANREFPTREPAGPLAAILEAEGERGERGEEG
jgi:hypothetical protein